MTEKTELFGFGNETVSALEKTTKFTAANEHEDVIKAALKAYDWILEQQSKNRLVVALDRTFNGEVYEHMITNRELAKEYYKKRG